MIHIFECGWDPVRAPQKKKQHFYQPLFVATGLYKTLQPPKLVG